MFRRGRASRTTERTLDRGEEAALPEDWHLPIGLSESGPSRKNSTSALGTLGVGRVATVDAAGALFPTGRPLCVDFWFGTGDRWIKPAREATVRQTRVAGLPVVETRVKAGEGDIVWTARADEAGDGHGRVVVDLSNQTDVAVSVAVVLRPFTTAGSGSISSARSHDDMLIVDRLPVVMLPREPGGVFVGNAVLGDLTTFLEAGSSSTGDRRDVECPSALATIAAVMPLTPGVDRQVRVVSGVEAESVAPAPVDKVVEGWKSYVGRAPALKVPSWPEHIGPSLISGLLLRASEVGRHDVGLDRLTGDDAHVVSALAAANLDWSARELLARLLDAALVGHIRSESWAVVGDACGRVATLGDPVESQRLFEPHAEMVAKCVGAALERGTSPLQRRELENAVQIAAGERAAQDVAAFPEKLPDPARTRELLLSGIPIDAGSWPGVSGAANPETAADAAVALATASYARYEPDHGESQVANHLMKIRALAGQTWSWTHGDDSDSPLVRAALFNGLRALMVHETSSGVDLVPGMNRGWYGKNLEASRMRTRSGMLSFALRWHGERAALLWEFEPSRDEAEWELTFASMDPDFTTTDRSGEALLAAPADAGEAS